MALADATTAPRAVRTDIQGLRAIAVSLVLVFHLAPASLTGGYAGVDVFFVISGFLITLHLLERIPRGAGDLVRFWSRRVRRLLPASLLVLGSTLVASRLLAPETQWANTAEQARAATLYVVNWLLSRDAVDYLAAENAPSPVQHFWSLSVEEQFYFGWPILILLLAALARLLRRNPLPIVFAGLIAVVAASLAYSVQLTASNPAAAYFVTPTRVWELGIGGLIATVTLLWPGRLRPVLANPLALVGLAAIGWTAVTYSDSTPFPGWQAAVPVLGTAAVIAAQSERGFGSPGPVLALRPVQWLGDVSYSVYLWHWPLVVIVPQVTGHELTWTERGSVLLATLALAAATKALIEDRFRARKWAVPLPKPFLIAGVAMAVVIAGTAVQLAEVSQRSADSAAALARGLAGNDPCFGARALDADRDCAPVKFKDLAPAPIDAASDKSAAYNKQANGKDCWSYLPKFPQRLCTFGHKNSPVNVALIGNSHAGQWLPALQRVAKEDDFKITTLLASQCALSDLRQKFATTAQATACLNWVHRTTTAVIDLRPDLVVMTNRISVPAEGRTRAESTDLYGAGYRRVLERFRAAGISVLVLRDTPAPGVQIPDCIATKGDRYAACDGTRATWLPPAPERSVVAELDDKQIRYADLTDHICGPTTCSAVTGGVVTYFDASHLTATFASTLAPYLAPEVREMLAAKR